MEPAREHPQHTTDSIWGYGVAARKTAQRASSCCSKGPGVGRVQGKLWRPRGREQASGSGRGKTPHESRALGVGSVPPGCSCGRGGAGEGGGERQAIRIREPAREAGIHPSRTAKGPGEEVGCECETWNPPQER